MRGNLFDPIFKIFEKTYDPRNPPMIYSCIRDLFDMILRRGGAHPKGENEHHSPKFVDYLIKQNMYSRSVLTNKKYEEIFGKYRLPLAPDGPPLPEGLINIQERPEHASSLLDDP